MSSYQIHTIDSAPERARPALRALQTTFGFLPNIAGAMAGSPTLLEAFAGVFRAVHTGSFTEAQIQAVLLTNAITNQSAWPIAFHATLALKAGVAPADVKAIREQRAPADPQLAAVSALARAMIEQRGRVDEPALAAFCAAGFGPDQVLELILIVAASTITNYTASITRPPIEPAFEALP